jgi:hypothetical protein
MSKYKKMLLVVFGLILVLSPIFIHAQSITNCGRLVCNPAPGLFTEKFGTDFKSILTNALTLILGLAGLVAVAYIIIGGYQIAMSRGNEDAAKIGRKTLTNAIIGLVIIILSYVIVSIVVNAAFGNVK